MRTAISSATNQVPIHAVIDDWANALRTKEIDGFKLIAEGLPLIDKAMRYRHGRPYPVKAGIPLRHVPVAPCAATDWAQVDVLYAALETLQPSPVLTLNRAVDVARVRGPAAALAMIEPLAARLAGSFHYFGVKGALLMQMGRAEEARVAFDRAIALADTSAEAAHIRLHFDRLMEAREAAGSGELSARAA